MLRVELESGYECKEKELKEIHINSTFEGISSLQLLHLIIENPHQVLLIDIRESYDLRSRLALIWCPDSDLVEIKKLKQSGALDGFKYFVIIDENGDHESKYLTQYLTTLSNIIRPTSRKVHFLMGGHTSLQDEYPWLCKRYYSNRTITAAIHNNTMTPSHNMDYLKNLEKLKKYRWELEGNPYRKSKLIYPCEIIENKLYLGEEDSASPVVLNKLGIDRVIRLGFGPWKFNHDPYNQVVYKDIHIKDTLNEPIHHYFSQIFDFINTALEENKSILIHCQAGIR